METFKAGHSFQQPDPVEDVPAYCRESWTRWLLKTPSNTNYFLVLWSVIYKESLVDCPKLETYFQAVEYRLIESYHQGGLWWMEERQLKHIYQK